MGEHGSYIVYEITLIDGDDKRHRLIGVIHEGCVDLDTGKFGSVYLRPGLEEVGKLESGGVCNPECTWVFRNKAWYKPPSVALPRCRSHMHGGGRNANTPLRNHLAHALDLVCGGEAGVWARDKGGVA